MKIKTIFVACDTSNLSEIKKIIKQTQTNKLKIVPKFGLQFFYSKKGRMFLENFKKDFWLDLKINDIPQTALSAVDSLKDLKKCKYITVHTNGGLEMLKAIKKKTKSINKDLKVLCVTILTSLNNKSLKEIGHTKSVEQLVIKQAGLIKKSGCDGIVCSAQEAKMVRKNLKSYLL
ncbi:orotidine 5'-phosphate decarboxylase [Candidatus Pelagibacter sp.]|nr:orotidine 5'-phosphate decarboxylase [Candidatus Pelagibacter sp.]